MAMISVLVPARGRFLSLSKLLDSYEATRTPGASELVFRTDDNDEATTSFLHERGYRTIVGPQMGYLGIHDMYNELAAATTGSLVMCANDDTVFVTKRWDAKLLEASTHYLDGIVLLEAFAMSWPVFPFTTVSREVVRRLGFIYPTGMIYGDRWMWRMMKDAGRVVDVPDVQIDHDCKQLAHTKASYSCGFGTPAYIARDRESRQHVAMVLFGSPAADGVLRVER